MILYRCIFFMNWSLLTNSRRIGPSRHSPNKVASERRKKEYARISLLTKFLRRYQKVMWFAA